MPLHTCQKCGESQNIGKNYDLDEEECYNCGAYGKWKDELTEMVKEKIEKISSEKIQRISSKKIQSEKIEKEKI